MADNDLSPGIYVLAPLNDPATEFTAEVAIALEMFLAGGAGAQLDDGQRALLDQARRKIEQVVAELHDEP